MENIYTSYLLGSFALRLDLCMYLFIFDSTLVRMQVFAMVLTHGRTGATNTQDIKLPSCQGVYTKQI